MRPHKAQGKRRNTEPQNLGEFYIYSCLTKERSWEDTYGPIFGPERMASRNEDRRTGRTREVPHVYAGAPWGWTTRELVVEKSGVEEGRVSQRRVYTGRTSHGEVGRKRRS